MKLKTLALKNFKGIKNATFDFDGKSADVFGKNGSGKTTLNDAVTWLLFGKSSKGTTNFCPKVKDKNGEFLHNLENSVEATFYEKGEEITLKRVFSEKWTRKKGDSVSEFTGNTTTYYIDGVPSKEKEYSSFIEKIIPCDKIRILSSPLYFVRELPWQERRKILFELCDNFSDKDIINMTPSLSALPEILGKLSVEDYQKATKVKCIDINKELEIIPARIDEAEKAIPDLAGLSPPEIEKEITELESQKAEKAAEIAGINQSEIALKIRTQIAELEAFYAEKKNEYSEKIYSKNAEIYKEKSTLDSEISIVSNRITENESKASALKARAERLFQQYNDCKAKYKAVKAKKWLGDTVCYACSRPLEEEKIEEAIKAFETEKKKQLDSICEEVKANCSEEIQTKTKQEITELLEKVDYDKKTLESLKIQHKKLSENIGQESFDTSPDAELILTRIKDLKEQAQNSESAEIVAKSAIKSEIEKLAEKINNLNADKAKFKQKEAQENRIKELLEREKELAAFYEKLQHGLSLCEDFIKEKSEFISKCINNRFQTLKFSFFRTQINGGIQEACDILITTENGAVVPYDDANFAAQYNAGLEIIDVLSELWDVSLPLILDGRESVTNIISTNLQIISLFVSPKDKVLRTETQGE